MAQTKAQIFVPNAIERVIAIKRSMEQLAQQARSLRADFVACGGNSMAGADTYDYAIHATTRAEFEAGMLDLAGAHNSATLASLVTVWDDVTNLAAGRET